jgi:thiamine biosynthesis lipoprotein
MIQRVFRTMGTEIRVLVGGRRDSRLAEPDAVLAAVEDELVEFDLRLSRFRPASELSRLNGDPRNEVPASALLRGAVRARLWAAQRTGGLVDPTLLAALVRTGYTASWSGTRSVALAEALAGAPPRAPTRGHDGGRFASWTKPA